MCVWVSVNMFWDRVSQSNLELPSLSKLAPVSVSHPCLRRLKLQADQPPFMWVREGHNHWIKVQIIDVFVWTDLLSFVLSSKVLRASSYPALVSLTPRRVLGPIASAVKGHCSSLAASDERKEDANEIWTCFRCSLSTHWRRDKELCPISDIKLKRIDQTRLFLKYLSPN